jgi:hypothetical protein
MTRNNCSVHCCLSHFAFPVLVIVNKRIQPRGTLPVLTTVLSLKWLPTPFNELDWKIISSTYSHKLHMDSTSCKNIYWKDHVLFFGAETKYSYGGISHEVNMSSETNLSLSQGLRKCQYFGKHAAWTKPSCILIKWVHVCLFNFFKADFNIYLRMHTLLLSETQVASYMWKCYSNHISGATIQNKILIYSYSLRDCKWSWMITISDLLL